MLKDTLETFMNDFSLLGDSYVYFMANHRNALQRFDEFNLVLN